MVNIFVSFTILDVNPASSIEKVVTIIRAILENKLGNDEHADVFVKSAFFKLIPAILQRR